MPQFYENEVSLTPTVIWWQLLITINWNIKYICVFKLRLRSGSKMSVFTQHLEQELKQSGEFWTLFLAAVFRELLQLALYFSEEIYLSKRKEATSLGPFIQK